jgi:hypothetical protein
MESKDGSVSYYEAFGPDDPTLIDHYPENDIAKLLGDSPPTATQQQEGRYKLKRLAERNSTPL